MSKPIICTVGVFIHSNLKSSISTLQTQCLRHNATKIQLVFVHGQDRCVSYMFCVSRYQLSPNGYRLPVQSITIKHLNGQVNKWIKFWNQMRREIREGGGLESDVPGKNDFSTFAWVGGSPQAYLPIGITWGWTRKCSFPRNPDVIYWDTSPGTQIFQRFPWWLFNIPQMKVTL